MPATHRFYVSGSFEEVAQASLSGSILIGLVSFNLHIYDQGCSGALQLSQSTSWTYADAQFTCIIKSGLQTMQTTFQIADHQDSHCDCYYGDESFGTMHQFIDNAGCRTYQSISLHYRHHLHWYHHHHHQLHHHSSHESAVYNISIQSFEYNASDAAQAFHALHSLQ